jgi:hypothetical protein
MNSHPLQRAFLAGLVVAGVASPWSPGGTRHVLNPITEVLRHRSAAARGAAVGGAKSVRPVAANLPDAGQIALLDDSEGAFLPAVSFDFDNRTLRFEPASANASQYTYVLTASGFDPNGLTSGTALRLGDDDAAQVSLPFSFPFFGQLYTTTYIGSDGQLTLSAPEASSTARDLSRFVSGPPRLAPLFADLDPTQPTAAIRYSATSDRLLVTWNNVPLFADTPGPGVARQTFQAALYPSGRIEFSYRGVNPAAAVVGIAPGGSADLTQVDFTVASTTRYSAAVAEDFSGLPTFDFALLAEKFYRNHEDSYDFLVVFDAASRGDLGCAFTLPIRNWVHGLGLRVTLLGVEEFNATSAFGSAGRLQNMVYFGPLQRYLNDPTQVSDLPDGCGRNSVMSILGQEAGHRFLAYPTIVDPATGQLSAALLGRDFAHWSFFLNTDASVMEGNQIQDRGEGASPRFVTRAINERYSNFDHYFMGLRAPEDVPATFLVRQPSIATTFAPDHSPQTGISFDGTRVAITVPMIVAAEGPRAPDFQSSPKRFRFAFALLLPAGQQAAPADIAKLETIRTAWETFFNQATSTLGTAETKLQRQVALSIWPAAGVVAGRGITATVTLGVAAAGPVTINLSAANGSAGVPASVTVAAGSRSANFSISGNTAGLAEIVARGPDDSYETARAFVQVRSSTAGLILEQLESTPLIGTFLTLPALGIPLHGGPGVPLGERLKFRVRDSNALPYPGLRLNASASGGGAISPSNLVTDSNGVVEIEWRLANQPGPNTLTVSLEGQPDVTARVPATGVYQPTRRRGF